MTTDSLTASPTPFGPPPAFMPLYDATIAAIRPKISALANPCQTSAICAMTSWWSMLTEADLSWRESRIPGGMAHACEIETSLLLQLRGDLVDMSKAVDEVDGVQTSENIYWDLNAGGAVTFQEFFSRNTLSGVQGQPTLATAEKGARAFDAAVSHLARFLGEFRAREIRPRRDLHDAEKYPAP